MLKTIEDFHKHMDYLYNVAVENGVRFITINTGPNLRTAEKVLSTWRPPGGEFFSEELILILNRELIFLVKW